MRKLVFAALAAMLVLFVGLALLSRFNRGEFYIEERSYSGDVSTTVKELWFEFNKPIEDITLANQQQHVTFEPAVSFIATNNNNRLTILIKDVDPIDEDGYTIGLSLSSIDGDLFEQDIGINVKYGSGEAVFVEDQNDSFESIDPIIKQLPYQTIEYTIDYELPNSNLVATERLTIRVSMNFGPSYGLGGRLPNAEEYQAYIERVRLYRREALNYIESLGYSLDEFNFEYGETEGLEGFPTSDNITEEGHESDI